MNLVLDFGNTRIKAGIFEGKELRHSAIFQNVQDLMQASLIKEKYQTCILASVTREHKKAHNYLAERCQTLLFGPETSIPILNRYKSPSSLGSDRLLASLGAFTFFPDRPVLTIDAGTCIKYNFVNGQNEFLGGAISPGISMRLRAMHQFTNALPLIEVKAYYTQLIGDTTETSLLSGAILGAASETDAMIERYKANFPELQVVLTGGDCGHLSGLLKNTFFAQQNLVLIGLNTVLIHAAKP